MSNLPLFARSRRSDPDTSREAAQRMNRSGRTAAQARAVLDALRANPGATSAELAEAMGVDRFLTARRLPDLRTAGRVKNGDKRVCQVNGTRAVTWEAL